MMIEESVNAHVLHKQEAKQYCHTDIGRPVLFADADRTISIKSTTFVVKTVLRLSNISVVRR
ncbi:hypothetical protein ACPOL_2650 [Acidisarcina polymorpha]|uniref:Uncharacterized protein n=1 Tax=Acidisarcina polymorpha TaxID=2211140 RepID=A0A2Z5FYI2_9BACT|nr:hypothetical protein ACPOL_2650 [Acidisarcina polymorpha]